MPYVRQAGIWKSVLSQHVRQAGIWKPVLSQYVRQAGIWKQVLGVGGGTPPPGGGSGPSGPPTSATSSIYNVNRISISVVLGDSTAQTRVYRNNLLVHTLEPGFRIYQTPYTSGSFKVSHYKGGQESTLRSVSAPDSDV